MKKELEKRKTEVVAQWRSEGGGERACADRIDALRVRKGPGAENTSMTSRFCNLDDAIHKKLIVLFCTLRGCPDEILTNSVTETAHR